MKQNTVRPANLNFNSQGIPISKDFGDIYFSKNNGLEEKRYVFLKGNHIPARFNKHPRNLFVVAETGFGTGLNFLALYQTFENFRTTYPQAKLKRLHFISFEKFPLTRDDLTRVHRCWPELTPWANKLQIQWPLPLSGCHRLLLNEGQVTLDLWFGDVNHLINTLDDSLDQQIDAWFLDGFSPAKNPDIWSNNFFLTMARLARPGATFSTFTSASFVRSRLQNTGFTIIKRKGFANKREMLTGRKVQQTTHNTPTNLTWFTRKPSAVHEIAIIGGGIASALLSLALIRRGNWKVTLYCADPFPAKGASGNPQGTLYPLINTNNPIINHFFLPAFTFARRLYDVLPIRFTHNWCGVTQISWDKKSQQKISKILALCPHPKIAIAVNAEQIKKNIGLNVECNGIQYQLGGWLCPEEFTKNTIALAQLRGLSVHYNHCAQTLHYDNNWKISFKNGQQAQHKSLVLANGHNIGDFLQTKHLPVYPVSGQITKIPTNTQLIGLRQVLCYNGYLMPYSHKNQQHCIGASYHRWKTTAKYSDNDQYENLQRLLNCFPYANWAKEINITEKKARCGIRCATRDHLPMIGNIPNYEATLAMSHKFNKTKELTSLPIHFELFMLGALGSRGLCSAPLSAEILAAQISNEPIPLDKETLAALNPNRLWINNFIKRNK